MDGYSIFAGIVQMTQADLTSNQILNAASSPVQLLPALSNQIYVFHSVVMKYNFVSAAYATNTTFEILYQPSAGQTVVTSNATLLQATASRIWRLGMPAPSNTSQYVAGSAVNFRVITGNPTAGDSTLNIYLFYTLLTV